MLILTSCVLVTVSLLPLATAALAQNTSTEVNALIKKGLSLSHLGNYTQAIQYFDKVLSIDPKYVKALNNKGNALDDLGNHTGAIQYYDKALAIDPKNVAALYNKGLALYRLGNHTGAIQPNNVLALTNKGAVLGSSGNNTGAIQYYDKALAIDPKYENALSDKAITLDILGNHTGPLQYYDKALAMDPKYVNALNNKAITLDNLGNHTGALQYYDKVLSIDPKHVNTLYNKGTTLDELGNHTGAIQYYDKVLAIDPKDVYTLNNKGNALGKLGKYIEATKYYQKAIKILQSNQSNQSAAGYSHTGSSVASAVPIYTYAVANQDLNEEYIRISDSQNTSQDQKLIIIQINYAKSLVNIGQYQLAIVTYTEILQKDPYNGCALLSKADALDKSGQHEEAAKDYDIAKKLNPVCDVDTTNLPKKADQPSQLGALVTGISSIFSQH